MQENQTIWLILRKLRVPILFVIVSFALSTLLMMIVPGTPGPDGTPTHLSFFDAFYVVVYTATTIGYGEIPQAFSYEQRFMATISIFLTVPVWFFAIGKIVTLLQDKVFLRAIAHNRFAREVANIKSDFIVICGYNRISKLIIEKLIAENRFRIVVIDKSPEKIDELALEEYHPHIPALMADITQTSVLRAAGVSLPNCRFIVTLFEDDDLNLKISVKARILNANIKIIGKATVKQGVQNLIDLGVDKVIDPFDHVATRLDFALRAPFLFTLLNWINGGNLNVNRTDLLPRGRYIVCSRGRFGKSISAVLEKNGIEYVNLDINKEIKEKKLADSDSFKEAGIETASAIIAGTADDAINLSIVMTARKLNPSIFVLARENELEESSMFAHLKAEKVFLMDRLVAISAFNYIARPLADQFINKLSEYSNEWAKTLVIRLTKTINKKPRLAEIMLTCDSAHALCGWANRPITYGDLVLDPWHNGQKLKIVIIAVKKVSGELIMAPDHDYVFEYGDDLLIAGTPESINQFEHIINNEKLLHFVLTGSERRIFIFEQLQRIMGRTPPKEE
ncbi:MAG: NAD-binding protein [Campylobacterales bacterium]